MEEMSIDQLLDKLDTNKKYITDSQASRMANIANRTTDLASGDSMGDLLTEVQAQMICLKSFRKRVADRGDAATTRDLKDMIQASTSLFTMLTKMNEGITNQERLRKVEQATIEAIKTLPGANQQVFFSVLEESLAK
jgi:hypothetical protein